jgi:hypothetical protein
MAEAAAKAKGAVKQKNRTLVLPPALQRSSHDDASRLRHAHDADGALFCLTASKPSQTPRNKFNDRREVAGRPAAGGDRSVQPAVRTPVVK